MTRLINLLPWKPGHSGFGGYVQRVVPGIDGLRLQLGNDGQAVMLTPSQWSSELTSLGSRVAYAFFAALQPCATRHSTVLLSCNATGSSWISWRRSIRLSLMLSGVA